MTVIIVGCAYMLVLVLIARAHARRPPGSGSAFRRQIVYALSFSVYCTSWMYLGAVGDAITEGWQVFAYYLGPALALTLGRPLWQRLLKTAKREKATSLADFLSNRYGKSRALGVIVTFVALIAAMPHVALQLRSLAAGWSLVAHRSAGTPEAISLCVAGALLAMFAILLGGRKADLNEANRGLVYTLSVPALVKIGGLVALACYALWQVQLGGFDVQEALKTTALARPFHIDRLFVDTMFVTAAAMFCFPKQFHVGFVTATDEGDSRHAWWILPIYLLVAALAIVPIVAAGSLLPGHSAVPPSMLALGISLASNHAGLTVLVAMGVLSAAASMIVVETIALAAMVSNEMVLPWMTWRARRRREGDPDFSTIIVTVRQVTMAVIIACACIFVLATDATELRSFGIASFIAAAQLMPAVIGAVYWERASLPGAIIGIIAGLVAWAGCGFVFGVTGQYFPNPGLGSLLFTIEFSLGVNVVTFLVVSLLMPTRVIDRIQARSFVRGFVQSRRAEGLRLSTRVGELESLIAHFIGEQRARESFAELRRGQGSGLGPTDRVTADVALAAERMLAGAIGVASARGVISTALATHTSGPSDIVAILDDAAHAVEFSRSLLQSTIENLPQGICVFDAAGDLSAWNRRLADMFAFSGEPLAIGQPTDRFLARINQAVVAPLRAPPWRNQECVTLDGRSIAVSVATMEGAEGGSIVTFHDVSELRRQAADLEQAAFALERANETLEARVLERTRALGEAKLRAERADASKTRFLAAASHDLLQPLHAARLFVGALIEDLRDRPASIATAQDANHAIDAADRMLRALLDVSRMDALDLQPLLIPIQVSELLREIGRQFLPAAAAKRLSLRFISSRAVIKSDPDLLRSILQNLISNAIRYTALGGVLVGCRNDGDSVRIEVWDTGRGIAPDAHERIFGEFVQLEDAKAAAEGMGLGLAIVDRLARRLGHSIDSRSTLGRGSVFSLTVPRATMPPADEQAPPSYAEPDLTGLRVLCVDDDHAVLASLAALLPRWGVEISCARSQHDLDAMADQVWDAALIDYRLQDGVTGFDILSRIGDRIACAAIVTADATPELSEEAACRDARMLRKPVDPDTLRSFLIGAYASELMPADHPVPHPASASVRR